MSADVLIAGGGIAGASLAILLGRRGIEVDLFEERHFPREKPCGEGLMPGGVGVLERIGIEDRVGGAPFVGVRYHAGEAFAEARFPRVPGVPDHGLGQRRLHLDGALFEIARETKGVRVHEGVRAEAIVRERGRVEGLVVCGSPRRAPITVIADGARSRLAASLGLGGRAPRRERVGVRAHFRLARDREAPGWVEIFLGDGFELYTTPLPGREILIAALCARRLAGSSLHADFDRWIAAEPALRERLTGAERVSALAGRAPLSGRVQRGVAPGAILLGDAAGYTDPVTGGGMAQALISAELCARYVPRALGEESDVWLARFDRRRRRMLRDQRLLTAGVLALVERPLLSRAAIAALGAHPRWLSHLAGVAAGITKLW